MTTMLACPDETELLVLAMGEPVASALASHVDGCDTCQTRVARLQAEVALLRQNHDRATPSPSTEPNHATTEHDAEPPDPVITREWPPGNPAGPEAVAAACELAEGLNAMPDAIGRYRVIGRLGSGGEADVYRVAGRAGVDQPQNRTPAGPLRGRIDLLVVKSKDGNRRSLRLADPRAVPVRAADEFRIEARLDRPAFLYLFWLDSEGKVAPLYPWKEHDWAQRPAEEQKVTGAELPEIITDILEIPASAPGLETLVLLAREDSPLPREDEAKLAQGLSGPPVPLPADVNKSIWVEDGEEVTFELTAGLKETVPRSVPNPTPRKSDDPVLRIRKLLSDKVQPLGDYWLAVVFPNEGGELNGECP